MSKLSFKVFCIENYAQHTGRPGTEIYAQFSDAKLLELLDTDYEDLHGMGREWLMQFFDRYLKGGADHSAVRTAVLPSVLELIVQEYGISEDAALEAFYRSATGAAFADDETGLYGQSPNFIFTLFRAERQGVLT